MCPVCKNYTLVWGINISLPEPSEWDAPNPMFFIKSPSAVSEMLHAADKWTNRRTGWQKPIHSPQNLESSEAVTLIAYQILALSRAAIRGDGSAPNSSSISPPLSSSRPYRPIPRLHLVPAHPFSLTISGLTGQLEWWAISDTVPWMPCHLKITLKGFTHGPPPTLRHTCKHTPLWQDIGLSGEIDGDRWERCSTLQLKFTWRFRILGTFAPKIYSDFCYVSLRGTMSVQAVISIYFPYPLIPNQSHGTVISKLYK